MLRDRRRPARAARPRHGRPRRPGHAGQPHQAAARGERRARTTRPRDVAIDIGQQLEGFDRDAFRRRGRELVARNQGATVGDIQAGAVIGELTQIGAAVRAAAAVRAHDARQGAAQPRRGRAHPRPDASIRTPRSSARGCRARCGSKLLQAASPGQRACAAAMEAKEFAERLPGRVNKVMDALAEGELTLNIQGIDEQDIMRGVQKLANRVTAGRRRRRAGHRRRADHAHRDRRRALRLSGARHRPVPDRRRRESWLLFSIRLQRPAATQTLTLPSESACPAGSLFERNPAENGLGGLIVDGRGRGRTIKPQRRNYVRGAISKEYRNADFPRA